MENQQEIWKDVKGYEGRYEVSNFGSVRSLFYIKYGYKKILKGSYDDTCVVVLKKNNEKKSFLIDKLVAAAFLENPENKKLVFHKDGKKINNNVENLEWCNSLLLDNNKFNKKVINTKTGKIYDNIISAAIFSNTKPSILFNKLEGFLKNNTNLQYYTL